MMNKTHASRHFWLLLLALVASGALIQWRETAGEISPARKSLAQFPVRLGAWQQSGVDQRFEPEIESVLRADDYLMRDYSADGKNANLYIGYYASQRTGATYHSPRNCLPGSGWTMRAGETVEIETREGKNFVANRYTIENQNYKFVMIYWYQGRGRFIANEYADKFFTVWDSIARRRSDAAMVRVIVAAKNSESEALETAKRLSREVAANLSEFVPN
jgi:EpsI family protein